MKKSLEVFMEWIINKLKNIKILLKWIFEIFLGEVNLYNLDKINKFLILQNIVKYFDEVVLIVIRK